MKKLIEMVMVVILLVMVSTLVLVCGCNESAAVVIRQVSSDELLKPQGAGTELGRQWVKLYGTGAESVEHYNIALNRLLVKGVGGVVDRQGKYISDLADPNSLAAKVERIERRASNIELSTSNLEKRIEALEGSQPEIVTEIPLTLNTVNFPKELTTLEYRETNGIPICPYCKRPTERTGGGGTATLVYYQPVYDEHGNNSNPDRNTSTFNWHCSECGNGYGTSGNAFDGFNYVDIGTDPNR